MSEEKTNYEKLAAINLNDKTEKKGRFTYLSWAWAADQLLRLDEKATWTFADPLTLPDGSMLVFCTVTAFGKDMTCQMPVINNHNKAISSPNAMDVNTAMMRGLAKCIALHGLGIYIYAGEDLPHEEGEGQPQEPVKPKLMKLAAYKKDIESAGTIPAVKDVARRYSQMVDCQVWNKMEVEEAGEAYHAKLKEFE